MKGRRASALLRWYLDVEHENIPYDIYATFRNFMIKEIMMNPEGVTLPLNLGNLKVVGTKYYKENMGVKASRARKEAEKIKAKRKENNQDTGELGDDDEKTPETKKKAREARMQIMDEARKTVKETMKPVPYVSLKTSDYFFMIGWSSTPIGVKEDILKQPFRNSEAYSFNITKPSKKALFKFINDNKWYEWHTEGFAQAPRIKDELRTRRIANRLARYEREARREEEEKLKAQREAQREAQVALEARMEAMEAAESDNEDDGED